MEKSGMGTMTRASEKRHGTFALVCLAQAIPIHCPHCFGIVLIGQPSHQRHTICYPSVHDPQAPIPARIYPNLVTSVATFPHRVRYRFQRPQPVSNPNSLPIFTL